MEFLPENDFNIAIERSTFSLSLLFALEEELDLFLSFFGFDCEGFVAADTSTSADFFFFFFLLELEAEDLGVSSSSSAMTASRNKRQKERKPRMLEVIHKRL